MNAQNVMLGTALEVLNDFETQWTEFRRKVIELAPRFKIVASEDDLKAVFEEVLELWQEYPLLWMLLNNQSDIAESKLPPSPEKALKFNPLTTVACAAAPVWLGIELLNCASAPRRRLRAPFKLKTMLLLLIIAAILNWIYLLLQLPK